jgi:tetratricopeptide (TPR) repeat protein
VKDRHLSKLAEYSLLLGSGAGAVASVTAQNVVYASAPLTLLVAMGLLNRSRLEKSVSDHQKASGKRSDQLAKRLAQVQEQVSALPSPEALTNFQRSVMDRSDRSFIRFSRELHQLERRVDERIGAIQIPDLSQVYRDIAQLQDQYTYTCAGLENLTAFVNRLSTNTRIEALEAQISQVKTTIMQTRVNVETLHSDTKTTVSHLQDSLHHLDRRLRQLPASLDPRLLREEVEQLVKTVTELVPRREFHNLTIRLQELSQRQQELQHALLRLEQNQSPTEATSSSPSPLPEAGDAGLADDVGYLMATVTQIQKMLAQTPDLDQTQEYVQQVMGQSLEDVSQSLQNVATLAQNLQQRQQQLSQQLDTVLATDPALSSATATNPANPSHPQWIMDFSQESGETPASRRALETALATAEERLLLVWPWSQGCALDNALVNQFRQVLERGCQLEIGWCHQGSTDTGRLLRPINQRWGTESQELRVLKTALNQLLPLRQEFPNHFRFKILGTEESYLVCDRSFAIVGLQSLPLQSQVFPHLHTKLRTTDPQVIAGLIRRFDSPELGNHETAAFFNRGTTRYDLRDREGAIADYAQVLAVQPDHAIARNNRGVALQDLGRLEEAEIDFTAAISHNPQLFAAYCNRGWLRLEQKRYREAAADFSTAIHLEPNSPIPYLYRGSAIQHMGDLENAMDDYDQAIACGYPVALPYVYRGAAHQRQGNARQAIADLEMAQQQSELSGDRQILISIKRSLSRLKRAESLNGYAYQTGRSA